MTARQILKACLAVALIFTLIAMARQPSRPGIVIKNSFNQIEAHLHLVH